MNDTKVTIEYMVTCEKECQENPPCEQEDGDVPFLLQMMIIDPLCHMKAKITTEDEVGKEVYYVISNGPVTTTTKEAPLASNAN